VKKEFCINPWRQKRDGDAVVTKDDVLLARYIELSSKGDCWFEVFTHDGRKITTELRRNQPDMDMLMTRLYLAGVRIERVKATAALWSPDAGV
jgi:hypothetical protein